MSTPRLLAVVSCVALMAAFGCRRGQPEATEEPSPEPSPTPSVESLGEFQLLGTVQQAFLDVMPDIEIPPSEQPPLDEGTAGRVSPEAPGVMRVSLEAFGDNLRDSCDADPEDRFNVYWTTDTLFDPVYAEADDMEASLENRELGVIGTVLRRPEAEEEFEFDTPSPEATGVPDPGPGVSDAEGEQTCVLVAEQVGTSEGDVPTPRPRTTRRATPSPNGVTETANN